MKQKVSLFISTIVKLCELTSSSISIDRALNMTYDKFHIGKFLKDWLNVTTQWELVCCDARICGSMEDIGWECDLFNHSTFDIDFWLDEDEDVDKFVKKLSDAVLYLAPLECTVTYATAHTAYEAYDIVRRN